MPYDLLNNNVRINGSDRVVHFNILSESREGTRRTLSLSGVDYEGNIVTATGWFDKCTYILKTSNVTVMPRLRSIQATEYAFSDDEGNIWSDDEGNVLTEVIN